MKKVIIIGGGIAGLSAGCYLQMNGYQTEIFELNNLPGGLCTAWRRRDYLIDGCIHWLVGINPESRHYQIWNELADIQTLSAATYDEFCSFEDSSGTIHFYADLDRFEKHLKEISPEDAKAISEIARAAKRLARLDSQAFVTLGGKIKAICGLLPLLLSGKKWFGSIARYSLRIKHPLIKKLFAVSLPGDTPMLIMLLNAAWFHNKNAGYPLGGAKELAGRIAKRYESLGGKINYNSNVTKILVENGEAKGIRLENGRQAKSDIVISAMDGRSAIFNLLEGKYKDKKIERLYYDKKYEPKNSTVYVALGVAREFDTSYKPYVFFDLEKPLKVDGNELLHLGVTIHNFDPQAAPEGKTVLTVMVTANDPQRWIHLRTQNREQYDREKNEIAERVISEVDRHFGHIREHLEMVDVATPATFYRYTNNWNGVPMGWQDAKLFLFKPNRQIKGLKNFFMCGHWVGDAGLPGASMGGRTLAKMICKQDGKKFVTK